VTCWSQLFRCDCANFCTTWVVVIVPIGNTDPCSAMVKGAGKTNQGTSYDSALWGNPVKEKSFHRWERFRSEIPEKHRITR
jgi:hypothetical protein